MMGKAKEQWQKKPKVQKHQEKHLKSKNGGQNTEKIKHGIEYIILDNFKMGPIENIKIK